MYGLRTLFMKIRKSTPFVATIPIIIDKYWFQYNDRNHTNFRPKIQFRPHLALRSAQMNNNFQELYDKCIGNVVKVHANGASGTGVIINTSGLIITNAHVVRDVTHVEIDLYYTYKAYELFWWDPNSDDDIQQLDGQVLYVWPDIDLALIRVYVIPGALRAIDMSASDCAVGDAVMCVGNPGANDWNPSLGMITGYYEWMNNCYDVFSHATAFHSPDHRNVVYSATNVGGFSGAPVINTDGDLVGIHSLHILAQNAGIPSSRLSQFETNGNMFAEHMRAKKYSTNAKKSLGIMVEKQLSDEFWIVYIANKNPLNQDSKNGLQVGDIIIKVNEQYFIFISQLTDAIDIMTEDKPLELMIERNTSLIDISIKQHFQSNLSWA